MAATRFMRKGITRVYLVPTIASAALVPTAVEVTAGVRVDTQLSELNGFNFSNSLIDVPDLSTAFVSRIPGEDSVGDSSMTFYELKGTPADTVKPSMVKGTVIFTVIFYAGIAGSVPAAADKCDVWPSLIASVSRNYSAGNEAATYSTVFALTGPPGEEKALT